jgi:hypothetical protein
MMMMVVRAGMEVVRSHSECDDNDALWPRIDVPTASHDITRDEDADSEESRIQFSHYTPGVAKAGWRRANLKRDDY